MVTTTEGGVPLLDVPRRPKPQTYYVPEIVSLANAGVLRVPQFQRNFVWDALDVRKLFDSIWRGFPIGTLLLWKNPGEAGASSFGPLEIKVDETTDALWIVDGQQRVTSLVGVLGGRGSDLDGRFNVFFDLRRGRFVSAGRAAIPRTWLPLKEALETRSLLPWLREHEDDLEPRHLDLADALGGALRDYQVPAYIVQGDDDLILREVFDRVNSAGKPIGRSQVFHALFSGEGDPGSPATVAKSLRRLGFGQIDSDRVLQSLLAIRGGDVARDVHDEFSPDEQVADWYEQAERAIETAIAFLRKQGVPHVLAVPSTLPLPVLAAFFHLHPEPEPWIEGLLARWIWRGWAHGFGRHGQTPALRSAIRAVNPRKGEPQAAPDAYAAVVELLNSVPDEGAPDLSGLPFRTDTALGRLILLSLIALTPLTPDGRPIDVAAALQSHGVDAITELVPKKRNLAARGFWPVDDALPTGHESSEVLLSHAIDDDAAAALRTGDFDKFLRRRTAFLEQAAGHYLSVRLDTGALIRPPLSALVVPDGDDDDG